MRLPLLLPALALLLCAAPAGADFLSDDLSAGDRAGRLVLGGQFVPAPAGPGKGWDGGQGWISGMRTSFSFPDYYGRKDFLLYRVTPGDDIPLQQGTLELWIQRHRPRGNDIDRDTLFQFEDESGRSLLTVAIVFPGSRLPPGLIVAETNDVWGPHIPISPLAVGEWLHLAFTWGPEGAVDNRVYVNGAPTPVASGLGTGDLSRVLRRAAVFKLATGYDDDDPAYHTLYDEFRFSGEIRRSFDLSRSALTQP